MLKLSIKLSIVIVCFFSCKKKQNELVDTKKEEAFSTPINSYFLSKKISWQNESDQSLIGNNSYETYGDLVSDGYRVYGLEDIEEKSDTKKYFKKQVNTYPLVSKINIIGNLNKISKVIMENSYRAKKKYTDEDWNGVPGWTAPVGLAYNPDIQYGTMPRNGNLWRTGLWDKTHEHPSLTTYEPIIEQQGMAILVGGQGFESIKIDGNSSTNQELGLKSGTMLISGVEFSKSETEGWNIDANLGFSIAPKGGTGGVKLGYNSSTTVNNTTKSIVRITDEHYRNITIPKYTKGVWYKGVEIYKTSYIMSIRRELKGSVILNYPYPVVATPEYDPSIPLNWNHLHDISRYQFDDPYHTKKGEIIEKVKFDYYTYNIINEFIADSNQKPHYQNGMFHTIDGLKVYRNNDKWYLLNHNFSKKYGARIYNDMGKWYYHNSNEFLPFDQRPFN